MTMPVQYRLKLVADPEPELHIDARPVSSIRHVRESDVPVVGRMDAPGTKRGHTDFRAYDGKLWHPISRGDGGPGAPALTYSNAWSVLNFYLMERHADADTREARGRNLIVIDGEPWQRSIGPLMVRAPWSVVPGDVSFRNPATTPITHKDWKGIVRWDRWEDALDVFYPEGRPDDMAQSGVEIYEPEAFRCLFDDQSVALEAFAWYYLTCRQGKKLASLCTEEVQATADLKDTLSRRYPGRRLFPIDRTRAYGWPHAADDMFSIADAADLVAPIEALLACDDVVLKRDTTNNHIVRLWDRFARERTEADLSRLAF